MGSLCFQEWRPCWNACCGNDCKDQTFVFCTGPTVKEICRELGLSRKVVRKVIRSGKTEFHSEREKQPLPKIGPWRERLDAILAINEAKTARERLTLIRVYEDLQGAGYDGSLRRGQAQCQRLAEGTRELRLPKPMYR